MPRTELEAQKVETLCGDSKNDAKNGTLESRDGQIQKGRYPPHGPQNTDRNSCLHRLSSHTSELQLRPGGLGRPADRATVLPARGSDRAAHLAPARWYRLRWGR